MDELRPWSRCRLALALPLALLAPQSAHAEQVTTQDVVGDAEAWTYYQDFQFVPAPQEASADITRTVVSFGDCRLRVAVHFRDLRVRPRHDMVVRLRTPRATFDVIATREGASRPTIELTNPRDDEFPCSSLRVGYDGAADAVRISVPASCIGSVRWVRLGVKATASPAADPDSQTTVIFYADDALREGGAGQTVRLGPRIHRG